MGGLHNATQKMAANIAKNTFGETPKPEKK